MRYGQNLLDDFETLSPEVQERTRRRMIAWYCSMAHEATFGEVLPDGRVSYGDLIHRNKPKLKDYLRETLSIFALRTIIVNGGSYGA